MPTGINSKPWATSTTRASLCSDSSIDRVCRMRLSTLAKPHCGERQSQVELDEFDCLFDAALQRGGRLEYSVLGGHESEHGLLWPR
jgi:hypothetical protein